LTYNTYASFFKLKIHFQIYLLFFPLTLGSINQGIFPTPSFSINVENPYIVKQPTTAAKSKVGLIAFLLRGGQHVFFLFSFNFVEKFSSYRVYQRIGHLPLA